MNIGFFLLPKNEVKYLNPDSTVRQALEKMKYHQYTAVPLVNDDGKYAGTLKEGDLLWKLYDALEEQRETALKTKLKDVPQRVKNLPVSINAEMEDLISLSTDQNFVPIIDDNNHFIGIVRRRDIIKYCSKLIWEKEST